MKKKNLLAGLALSFSVLVLPLPGFAAPLNLPQQGIVLTGAAKDQYIAETLQKGNKQKFAVPDDWQWEKTTLGGVKVDKFTADTKETDRVLLQLHGGAYVLGMSDSYRTLGLKQATLIQANTLYCVDYRLAPEHLYPAALDDALAAYKALLASGVKAKNIVVYGDSAGGNLALELALALKEQNIEEPAVLVLASPWTTFEHQDGTSRTYNDDKDKILGKGTPLNEEVKHPAYGGKLDKKDPKLSPIYADLTGLPPMLIQSGSHELFLTEDEKLEQKAAADGVPVTLSVYSGMSHDFALLLPDMEESVSSLQEIRDFVNRYMK